jgi:hypothetical protein
VTLAVALAIWPATSHADHDKGDHGGKKKKPDKLTWGGRVFVRGALSRSDDQPNYLAHGSLINARLKASYRWGDRVRAEIEFELAKPKVKNAFVKLRAVDADGIKLDVRAGNFKMPFSAIALTSTWDLPNAGRGLLDDVLGNRLQVSGRHVGSEVELSAEPFEIDAGIFQGTDDNGDPLDGTDNDWFGQDGVLRVSATPASGVTIGASGEIRSGRLVVLPVQIRHRWAADLDLTLDEPLGPGHIRAWLEGFAGSSWLVDGTAPDHTRSYFGGGRGVVGWRLGGDEKGACYVEPYLLAGAIDPDSKYGGDLVRETSTGLTYGGWDVWRAQLEVERWQLGANAPTGIETVGVAPTSSSTVLVQVGVHL